MQFYLSPQRNLEVEYSADSQENRLYEPTLRQTIESSVNQTFEGLGSQQYVNAASSIKSAQFKGNKITAQQYSESPYFRPEFPYFTNMTDEQARLASEQIDAARFDNDVLSRATGGRAAAGIAAGFVSGVVEPRNLAFGAATFGAGALLGTTARQGTRLKTMLDARRANAGYTAKAQLGAAEGLVAAALMEPGNRYAADILQDDYTMADSLFNVATSALLGTALEVAPKFIVDRFARFSDKSKAVDVTMRELDVAVDQLATGRKIDVGAVEKSFDGEIGTKSMNDATYAAIDKIEQETGTVIIPKQEAVTAPNDLAGNGAQDAIQYKENLSPSTLSQLESPDSFVIREKETGKTILETRQQEYAQKLNTAKYEAVPIVEHLANLNGQTYKVGQGAQDMALKVKSAALGVNEIAPVVARIDAERATALESHIKAQADPNNDTALDLNAIARLEDAEEALKLQKHIDELEKLTAYTDELNAMESQGLVSSKELEDLQDALNAIDGDQLQSAWEAARICLTRG